MDNDEELQLHTIVMERYLVAVQRRWLFIQRVLFRMLTWIVDLAIAFLEK